VGCCVFVLLFQTKCSPDQGPTGPIAGGPLRVRTPAISGSCRARIRAGPFVAPQPQITPLRIVAPSQKSVQVAANYLALDAVRTPVPGHAPEPCPECIYDDIWGAQQLRTGCLSILMFLAPLAEVTP